MANRYFLNIGANYNSTANWSATSGGTGGASVPTNVDDVFFDANSGNCTVNVASVAKSVNFTGYTNTITMTNTLTVSGSVTLVAAMTIVGASGLTINATGTFTSNGKTWPNALTFSATNTLTLADNLNVNGLLTIGGVTTVNGTFNINASGGITVNATFTKSVGTPKVNLTGGSWNGGGSVIINLDINGNVSIGNVVMGAATLTYVSGNVTHTGTLTIDGSGSSTTTLNTNGINWNNISAISGTFIILLQSDLNIYGLYTTNGGANNTTISGSFNINCYGGVSNSYGLLLGTGSPTLNLYGGTWSIPSGGFGVGGIQINTNIRGNITISGQVIFQSRTLRYFTGKVNCLVGSIFTLNTSTIIDCDKVNFRTVAIFSGATLTMNKFFSGSALIPTTVRAAASYTISFQDGFEKITKFTKISNCTVSRPCQLLCITDKSNKGGNVGIRYINQSPNGIAKNEPTSPNPMAYGLPSFLDSDPNFITG